MTLILAGFMSLAAILISLRFSKYITYPITRLFDVLKTIAAGDLTQNIEIKGKDEIATMTLLLRETQESFKKLITSIKKETAVLFDIGNDLAGNMNETTSAINEITVNIHGIEDSILKQSTNINKNHETMVEVVENIGKLNSHVEKQGSHISQASSAIEQMVANTRSVTETLIKNSENVVALLEASEVGKTDYRMSLLIFWKLPVNLRGFWK